MAAIGVRIRDNGLALGDMRDLVNLAENNSYDSVWLPESMGRDALGELTALLGSSQRIRIGTGIVPVFARLPTIAAAAIANAENVSPGRAILGVGIGHQSALEDGHGVSFSSPLQHVREFTTIARTLLSEGQINYTGDVYTVKHYQLEAPPTQPPPVFVAALRPNMLRMAGAVADGVLMNWVSLDYVPQALAYIRQGAEAAGRSLDDLTIASYLRTCVTDTPEIVEQATREQLARYASRVYYERFFASIGFPAEAKAIAQAWQRGDRDAAVSAVTEPMIKAVTIYGSPDECRQRLQAYRDVGLQLPIIAPFPIGEPIQQTFARTIEGCAV
ncbi:MAG: LLM class flavin-dependent oxidoreductase [bacterium]|nr:LLM class flavin-dependent oxidoreductase [bacterium]